MGGESRRQLKFEFLGSMVHLPIGFMGLVYLLTMNINQMLVNIPYMDPMGCKLFEDYSLEN